MVDGLHGRQVRHILDCVLELADVTELQEPALDDLNEPDWEARPPQPRLDYA